MDLLTKNYIDTREKCRHLKNLDFVEGVGDPVSHVGIFDPALRTVDPLTFSLVQLSPIPCVNKYTVYTYIVRKGGGGMGFWASER
jgi:hypothetical protein